MPASTFAGRTAINALPVCCFFLAATLWMSGCGRSDHAHADLPSPAMGSTAAAATDATTAQRAAAATVQTGGFDVQVSLSPTAKATLARRGETIVLSADYYGWPVDGASIKVDDVGQIDLGREQHELAAPGQAHFAGAVFPRATQSALRQPPEVNINVFSGRKSSPDNLLDCSIFQDAISIASKSPVTIRCRWLTEK
jgi:hypothetical protein